MRLIFEKGVNLGNINTTIFYTALIVTTALFQGCSGHALQDWIDGDSSSDASSKQHDHTTSDTKPVTPSQNKALNSISPSSTASDEHEEHRYMQKSTNAWIKNEWDPLTDSNTSASKKANETDKTQADTNKSVSSDDINTTGLQYYVDKAGIYIDNKKKRDANKTKAPSHTEKINAMPGIGKPSGRR